MLEMPNTIAAVLLATVLAVLVLGLSIIGFFMLWHIGAKGGHASFNGMGDIIVMTYLHIEPAECHWPTIMLILKTMRIMCHATI